MALRWTNWWAFQLRWSRWALALACAVVAWLHPRTGLPNPLGFQAWHFALGLTVEALWYAHYRLRLVPRLASFRPEDSGAPPSARDFDGALERVCFLIERDPKAFWLRVTGTEYEDARVPRSTMRSYVRSLLFAFDETPALATMLERGVETLAKACAAAGVEVYDQLAESDGEAAPNLIQGWYDDAHLAGLVRATPFVASVWFELLARAALLVLLAFGWRRGPAGGGMECWVLRPRRAVGRPLVLMPGAGHGLISFLPLALLLQRRLSPRTIMLYRIPHVEIGRPWADFPQWSAVVGGLVRGVREELGRGGGGGTARGGKAGGAAADGEFDMLAHSYGTAVANRLLRELCLERRHAAAPSEPELRLGYLGLIDPIVLGGASTGLVGCINQHGPDISFAFCANRAGVTTREVLDFDPMAHGMCRGLGVYACEGDILLDVHLARHLLARHAPGADCVVDTAPWGFHGRWLVELWSGKLAWGGSDSCVARCVGHVLRGLASAEAR